MTSPRATVCGTTKEDPIDVGTTGYRGPCLPPGHGWHRSDATALKAQVMARYKR